MSNWQVTSAIAKLFRDFATSLPASEPLNRPNPLEGKTLAITQSGPTCGHQNLLWWVGDLNFPACLWIKKRHHR